MLRSKLTFFAIGLMCFQQLQAQVNLQTGSSTFSLPVFNWQDDKSRLNSAVALSYSSGSGLRVSDVASNVGQGWNLIAGGVIVRMQVGEPDDQVARDGNGTDFDVSKYPNGILYANSVAYKGIPNAIRKYPIYPWKNKVYKNHNSVTEDKELDYFSFQFNGKAGMFVVDPTNIGVAQALGDTKMKITFQQDANLVNQGIRTRITSFVIQDVDGLKYKFTRHGLTKVLQTSYCDKNLVRKRTQPKLEGGGVYHQAGFESTEIVNPYIIGSWYLTEVEDVLTGRKVYFYYATRNINSIAGQEIIYSQDKNYCIVSHKRSITQTPVISSISYPDGHSATFNYGAARTDMNGDYVLSSIDVQYNSRYLSRHELSTTYFILNRYGTPVSDYQKRVARLCLKSVRKIGVDLLEDTPPYLFDYYTGSNTADDFVPPPFFYARDIWGYFNGNNSKDFFGISVDLNKPINQLSFSKIKGLCYKRFGQDDALLNAKPGYARNGLLRQVIYPTGGTLTYEYEQNTGVLNSATQNVGGVHVSKTSSTDGGFSNNCANPLVNTYDYVMNGTGSASSLWGLEMPVNSTVTYNHYQPERKKYKWTFGCAPFGCCYWKYQHPGILSKDQSTDLTGFQRFMTGFSEVMGVFTMGSNVLDVINLIAGATGWGYVIVDIISGLVSTALTCAGSQTRNSTNTTFYNSDLNGSAPLPTQFKRVEVKEGASGGIGKTVQEFTSSDDYPVWFSANPYFGSKQRFAPWAYGLPKKTSVYDASGNLIRLTENFYDTTHVRRVVRPCINHPSQYDQCDFIHNSTGLGTNMVSCKGYVVKSTSQRSTEWTNPIIYNDPSSYVKTSNNDLKVDFYAMYTGRILLSSTSEKAYKTGDPSSFVQTTTNYTYNNGDNNYELSSISTVKSDGTVSNKYIKYSSDYTGGVLTTLKNNNILAVPVETYTWITPSAGGSSILSEQVTEFTQLANGDIKPLQTLEQRFATPSPSGSTTLYGGPGSSTSQYKVTQVFTYDASGNLVGIKDEANRVVSNIYDYDDKYVVASAINCDPTDKKAYSSFETSGLGGWNLTGAASYVTTNAITGGRSFALSSGKSFSSPVIGTKPHVVSFWSTTGTVSVTGGATLVKSAPTYNGFTYYEYAIALGTTSVTVSGTGTIDELRLYPATARMRTVTYDPAIGKTSDCDENNRITYYEYDKLGRLHLIKDEQRNIVKMYEYNNISTSKQNGCPTTYYNRYISEVFTRNNCGAGYLGGDVEFTVAANTYSSALSQADADAQAENYILANGQAFANTNGTCTVLYFNTAQSQSFTQEDCPIGYVGGSYLYVVPAGAYSSTISQADANQQALDEIEANGQAYANDPANSNCTISYDPLWEWLDGAAWYCLSVNGQLPAHMFILETDINPNSSTFNQTRWSDVGPSEECPSNLYYNAAQSQNFTRNNCGSGYEGTTVAYTVPPGTYSSSVSQAAADQLATNDINSNGQNFANANGSCTPVSSNVTIKATAYHELSDYVALYTNTSTYQSYTFYIPSTGYQQTIGTLPAGTYNLTIMRNGGSTPWFLFFSGCGSQSQSGTSATFYSITVSSTDCNIIRIETEN